MRVLAIDAGTSALKASVFQDGDADAVVQESYPLIARHPGWAEQDPDDWWRACISAVRRLDLEPGGVDAISITGQMQDLVTLDGDAANGPAILYSDQRATEEHERLRGEFPDWARHAGSEPDSTNVAAKWAWLRRHEPARATATRVVLFGAHSYLVERMTGRALCDASAAASTGLFDVTTAGWWDEISADMPLPALVTPLESAVPLGVPAAEALGLDAGIPVVHAPGDAVAATVGVVGVDSAVPYAYLGTSGWTAAVVEARLATPAVWLPGLDPATWVAAAPILTAGAALDWVREVLLGGIDHATLDRLAASGNAAAHGVMMLPHLDGVRTPVADAHATGTLVGMRRTSDRATIASAAMEGVAHSVRASLGVVARDARELAVSGGLARSEVCMQTLADVCDLTLRVVAVSHDSLRGAAMVGAAAISGPEGVALAAAPTVAVVRPRPELAAVHRRLGPIFDDALDALRPTFASLAALRAPPASSDSSAPDRSAEPTLLPNQRGTINDT